MTSFGSPPPSKPTKLWWSCRLSTCVRGVASARSPLLPNPTKLCGHVNSHAFEELLPLSSPFLNPPSRGGHVSRRALGDSLFPFKPSCCSGHFVLGFNLRQAFKKPPLSPDYECNLVHDCKRLFERFDKHQIVSLSPLVAQRRRLLFLHANTIPSSKLAQLMRTVKRRNPACSRNEQLPSLTTKTRRNNQ